MVIYTQKWHEVWLEAACVAFCAAPTEAQLWVTDASRARGLRSAQRWWRQLRVTTVLRVPKTWAMVDNVYYSQESIWLVECVFYN